MPSFSDAQYNFTSGELDPVLRARSDITSYATGAQKLRNVLVSPQGLVKRRPGLEKIDTISGSGNTQLISFIHADGYTYLIVITSSSFIIYRDGIIKDTITGHGITEAQIPDITWATKYDTILLFHNEFSPKYIQRIADTNWISGVWTLNNKPTYKLPGTSVTTVGITIKDSTGSPIDFSTWVDGNTQTLCQITLDSGVWPETDLGRYIRGPLGGYALITYVAASPGSDTATATVLARFTNDKNDDLTKIAAGEWIIEDPVWYAGNYPTCGAFFQGRLWMAATPTQPNTLWASKVSDEQDFTNWLPVFDDNGIDVSAGGGTFTSFHRIFAGSHLFLFSSAGEYYIPISSTQPVTPTNVSLIKNSNLGSEEKVNPIEMDGALLFMRSGGKALIETQYNFAQGRFVNQNLSLLSSHLLNNPISMAYRKLTSTDEADYVLVVNEDGTLPVLCTLRNQDVTAWTRCATEGQIKNVAVAGADIYFIINRTIGRFLEKFNPDSLLDASVYLKSGTPISTVTGLTYLDGQEVQIVVDNTVYASQTVSGDSITLEVPGNEVHVGLDFPIADAELGYRTFVKTMPVELETSAGTSIGKKKRVSEVTLLVYETSHLEVRKNTIPIRRLGIDNLDEPVPKISGNIKIQGLLGWDDEIVLDIGQVLPLPMQILGLAYKVKM